MEKILISIPEDLAARFKALVPSRQRSRVIVKLIETEVLKNECLLHECALAVEQDEKLQREMKDWDATISDGIDDESW